MIISILIGTTPSYLKRLNNLCTAPKDTVLNPDKKILAAVDGTVTDTKVAADSSVIGDTVKFEITIPVPNTKKYEDHFWFVMKDQLPEGITFTGIESVKIGSTTLTDYGTITPASARPDLTAATYDGTTGYFDLKTGTPTVNESTGAITTTALDNLAADTYAYKETGFDAVKAVGGQAIEITFKEFKKFAEKNNLFGETVTITYTGVVNDDAKYDGTANENEVYFVYSNNPNHDYNGDNPGPESDDVVGVTPKHKTQTYTTSLKILKVDENGNPLPGAEFTLTGASLNRTVLTGYKFVETTYIPTNGEVVDSTKTYWKLLDGSYTTTDPATVNNTKQYASTETKYFKVTYTKDEITPSDTKDPLVMTSDASGVVEFVGLRESNTGAFYTLEETHSPDGYNKIDGTSTFTISWVDPKGAKPDEMSDDDWAKVVARGGFTLTERENTGDYKFGIAWDEIAKQFVVTIKNQSGATLPSTGGMGTTIFYVAGSIMVLAAAILLITKRRMGAND